MDVLIKGATMPKDCKTCGFVVCDDEYSPEYWCPIVRDNIDGYIDGIRPTFCPLVEIPPHGDLIDVDNLIEDIEELDNKPLKKWLKRFVNGSAVVIESEEQGHE